MPDRKNRKVVKINEMYEGSKAKNRTCPKCGPGVFMAEHKGRSSCGRCGYTEFSGSKPVPKPEETPEAAPEAKPEAPKEEAKEESSE